MRRVRSVAMIPAGMRPDQWPGRRPVCDRRRETRGRPRLALCLVGKPLRAKWAHKEANACGVCAEKPEP